MAEIMCSAGVYGSVVEMHTICYFFPSNAKMYLTDLLNRQSYV